MSKQQAQCYNNEDTISGSVVDAKPQNGKTDGRNKTNKCWCELTTQTGY